MKRLTKFVGTMLLVSTLALGACNNPAGGGGGGYDDPGTTTNPDSPKKPDDNKTECEKGNHLWEWVVTKEPTCLEDGEETEICSRTPSETRGKRPIPALGHDWEYLGVAPTCETPGSGIRRCKRDGFEEDLAVIPALGHNYKWETIVAATCTTAGQRKGTCDRDDCGHVIYETVNPLGHDFQNYVITTPATCTQDALETGTCTHDASHKDIRAVLGSALGHDFSRWVTTTPATCVDGPIETLYCVRDNTQPTPPQTRQIGPALGHRTYPNGQICNPGCTHYNDEWYPEKWTDAQELCNEPFADYRLSYCFVGNGIDKGGMYHRDRGDLDIALDSSFQKAVSAGVYGPDPTHGDFLDYGAPIRKAYYEALWAEWTQRGGPHHTVVSGGDITQSQGGVSAASINTLFTDVYKNPAYSSFIETGKYPCFNSQDYEKAMDAADKLMYK